MQIVDCNPVKLGRILEWGNGGGLWYLHRVERVKLKLAQLTDMCHQREGSKRQVRSEVPPTVELSHFAIWCVGTSN
jgi:hypothetical protein